MRICRLKFVLLLSLAFGCGDSGGGGDDAGTDAADMDDADVDASVPECTQGAKRCSGLVPETCDASGAWVAGTACDFVCDAGACAGECAPGAKRCSGMQPEVCNAAGAFESAGAACEFVCTAGDCEGACVPGATRCEGLSPQECDGNGQYQPSSADCPYVCDDGACTGTCVPGATRCDEDDVEVCDATGTFVFSKTCPQSCNDGACMCDADYVGDGDTCEPLDFCDASRGGCAPHATCTQVDVTPSCTCDAGYLGDGLACALAPVDEHFGDVPLALSAGGWSAVNSSNPVGTGNWIASPGNGSISAYDGPATACIVANFQSTSGSGTISNWLLTPEIDFGDDAAFAFYTRTVGSAFADRLEVRVCSTPPCTAPGQGSTAGFDTRLLVINDALESGGYPTTWTRYVLTNTAGIPTSGRGRIAFRYFVTDGGPDGSASDIIGIDAVTYQLGTRTYPVSGDVSFVGDAADITLSLNRQMSLPITSSGAFTFPRTLSPGTPYVITVQGAPEGTTCVVENGTGEVGTGPVTGVVVSCVTD